MHETGGPDSTGSTLGVPKHASVTKVEIHRMSAVIYSFSGTGNSLSVARDLAARIPDAVVFPIPRAIRGTDPVRPDSEIVGIVCPVYFFGLPAIVTRFVSRLEVQKGSYVFAVLTVGEMGDSALTQLSGLLQDRGISLDAGWMVQMPRNYVIMYDPLKKSDQEALFARERLLIEDISSAIRTAEKKPVGFTIPASIIRFFLYGRFIRSVAGSDKKFSVDPTCISCGTCERVCPVRNISLAEKKPVWHHHCERCLACFHYCPVHAIQWGGKTKGRLQYHNPGVKVSDMEAQWNGDPGPVQDLS